MAIARGIRRFDGRAAFSTWSYRVATNACLDELRRRRRRPVTGLTDDLGGSVRPDRATGGPTTGHRPAFATADDGTRSLDQVADQLLVDEALAGLPVEFRAPVVLRDLCDMDYAEIAEILDIPPGTVRSRIARGRAHLARALGARNPEAQPERPTQRTGPLRPPTAPSA